MQIDFYEEFPKKKNLEKLRLIKFPIRLFVAAPSLRKFKRLEKQVKKIKKNTEVAYWPIIPNSYWISPFSNTKDLTNVFEELEKIDNQILIDLELPLRNKKLIIKNLIFFFKNKQRIKKFLEKNKKRITTAEFPAAAISFPLKILGLSYNIKTEKSLMWYSSMCPKFVNHKVKKYLKKLKNKEDYSVSLGTIATGILGNEPILKPENLKKDFQFVEDSGFKKVIIFRLGGLNKNYIKIINKFTSN